jgi:hypothetical protein
MVETKHVDDIIKKRKEVRAAKKENFQMYKASP